MIEGQIDFDRGMDNSIIDKIISIGSEEEFDLTKGRTIIKLSGIPSIPHEIIIVLKIVGGVAGVWVANKFLDSFWKRIKSLIKKSKKKTGITPIIKIEGNRDLIINLNFKESSTFEEAFKKLLRYVDDHPQTKGQQWYNEELKEWGDINRVMEWKQIKNCNEVKKNE